MENKRQFATGICVKTQETKYGEIYKIGINLENFKNNPQNSGWVNLEILKNKEGKPYVVIDEFKSKTVENSNNIAEYNEQPYSDQDIPF